MAADLRIAERPPVLLSSSRYEETLLRLKLPRHVSGGYVESLNQAIDDSGADVLTLDITNFRRSRLLAEGALLGVLSLAERRGTKLNLFVGAPLPWPANSTNRYWKVFCESIGGFLLAQLAVRIVDPSGRDWTLRVLERQGDVLRSSEGLVWSGREVAAPLVDRFGSPPPAVIATSNDPLIFTALFREMLYKRFAVSRLSDSLLNAISEFAFEALQNTRDHGTRDLKDEPIHGVRFLSLRRLNLLQEGVTQEQTPVARYLEELRAELAPAHRQLDQLIEVTVADSGVGIPARMAHSMAVYEGELSEERTFLLRALDKSGTSKPASVAGAGLGLFRIMQATQQAKGLIVFRSGRLHMYRHYLGQWRDWPSLELREWSESEPRLIGGTSVSLLIPGTTARLAAPSETAQLTLSLP
jgi:hypothetical protein